jgi:cell division protein ZapA (FtsZ GTPase activity inhibitor)
MTSAGKKTVQVKIQGRSYRIRTEGDADARSVFRAATMLDETIERVRIRAGTVDSVDIAVLAALNIANSLVSDRDAREGAREPDPRLGDLVALLESALAPGGAASA